LNYFGRFHPSSLNPEQLHYISFPSIGATQSQQKKKTECSIKTPEEKAIKIHKKPIKYLQKKMNCEKILWSIKYKT